MRHPRSIVAILFAIAVAVVTAAAVLVPREPTPSVLEQEVARYRAMGPAGVKCFLEQYRAELDQPSPPQELREALDRICAQRDCIASRLYWYTDFEQAKDAARSEGKPILSLRLLGNLDEELSCLNSRFFRTALYANDAISDKLRNDFVLHWQSVRPVPVVRIDMGDGRELERTLTGNSIHYVLDAQGRPIDAIPGLYGPQAFLSAVNRAGALNEGAEELLATVAGQPEGQFASLLSEPLVSYHRTRLDEIQSEWAFDLASFEIADSVTEQTLPALAADSRALTKSLVERPLLAQVLGSMEALEQRSTEQGSFWGELSEKYGDESRLDGNSCQLIALKLTGTRLPDDPEDVARVEQTIEEFETRMALDTARNERLLHRKIHEWFVKGEIADVDSLNARVYDELFLTPDSDPWLGLRPEGVYTALDGDGIIVAERRPVTPAPERSTP